MNLAKLFSDNYEYLNTVAKRITRRKNIKLAPELLNTTYIEVFEKQERGKFIPSDKEDFVKWFCAYMNNCFLFRDSTFNKNQKLDIDEMERAEKREFERYRKNKESIYPTLEDNFRGELDSNPGGINSLVDEEALREIEISVERANDFTKELIEISSNLGKTKTLKYIELVEFKRSLPTHESILFELYFEKELSTRKIADLYSMEGNVMNYQSVNIMVNQIKSKIKTYKWKQLNS